MTFEIDADCTTNIGTCSLDDNFISLDKKIGSMVIMGFEGKDPAGPDVQKVTSYLEQDLLGGVIIFRHNIDSPTQLQSLTQNFITAKKDGFVSVDQEGGKVMRLIPAKGFQGFPSPAMVAQGSPEDAFKVYDALSLELADNGINLNFAPVVDVNNATNPCPVIGALDRSFSDDVDKVVEYASICIDAHHKNQIFTAIKHFPGHGFASGDSHLGLVDVTETARDEELLPFYQLIKQQKVDMVMTAHLMNRNLDPEHPATLSPRILKTLLRDKGYNGVVVSDDLHMGAIASHYSFNESVILAINAGCNILVFSNNPLACKNIENFVPNYDIPIKIIAVVKDAIAAGRIDVATIDDSYAKIKALKGKVLG